MQCIVILKKTSGLYPQFFLLQQSFCNHNVTWHPSVSESFNIMDLNDSEVKAKGMTCQLEAMVDI